MSVKFLIICFAIFNVAFASKMCGVLDESLYNKEDFLRAKNPWLTGLFHMKKDVFLCNGNLISNKAVLTNAHCVQDKSAAAPRNPNEILLKFGVFDLTNDLEGGRLIENVSRIVIHPDWNASSVSYDADLAILLMEKEILPTKFIKPICIWNSLDRYDIKKGVTIGFNFWAEGDHSKIVTPKTPSRLEIPIWTNEKCFLKNFYYAMLSSIRTFCGGFGEELNKCLGLSGSGLVVEFNNVFYLKGLLTATLFNDNSNCDSSLSIFTDVFNYSEWIIKYIGEDEPELSDPSCGQSLNAQSLVYGGKQLERGQMPWLVAFYKKFNEIFIFGCGANLISKEFVVTAAHCIQNKGVSRPLSKNDAFLKLGKHNLNDSSEVGSMQRNIARFVLHPSWNINDKTRDGDIALIKMSASVEYSEFIRPICLWPEIDVQIIGQLLLVGGWGINENGEVNYEFPKVISVPVVNEIECIRSHPTFREITSNRTICAGLRNEEIVCRGDSGSGLIFRNGKRWYLRGIVSASLLDLQYNCDKENFAVYADAAKYVNWIKNIISAKSANIIVNRDFVFPGDK